MINIGTRIHNYIVIAAANGYVLAANSMAADRFVVWSVDKDGHGVNTGRYFDDRMEAEWEFCGLAFEWFQDNVNINFTEDEENDIRADEACVSALEDSLMAAHRALDAALELVEEMAEEHIRLCPEQDRITDTPIDKVAREFAEDAIKSLHKRDAFAEAMAMLDGLRAEQFLRRANLIKFTNIH